MSYVDIYAMYQILTKEIALYCSFNATLMLEMLRGKRMLFVGDSLNRGQYVSLVCLLHRAIPESSKSMETFDSLTVFRAKVFIPLFVFLYMADEQHNVLLSIEPFCWSMNLLSTPKVDC
jgi:hypothetical protein